MSVEEVEKTVQLDVKDIFNHRHFLNKEIERFKDGFERNGRFKEFEALIKKNHMVCLLEFRLQINNPKMLGFLSSNRLWLTFYIMNFSNFQVLLIFNFFYELLKI